MSQIDRGLPKCEKSVCKDGDGSDLSLSGSQVSLIFRPRSVTGKASIRALSVTGPRVKRPMSAVPTMSFTEMTRDKRRPYSADSQLLASSCHQKRSKHVSCFTMSAEPIGLSTDFETDGDIEFSSSTLVSSNLSDQQGMAWMELEMKGLYLRNSDATQHSCSTIDSSDLLCCSDVSEEPTRSEKSLGQCIQAMARDHVQHDHLSFRHPTFSNEKLNLGVESKLGKDVNNTDPKTMSTQELHLQMVQSGLIPDSKYTSVQENITGEPSQLRTNRSCHHDLSKEFIMAQIKEELNKATTQDFHLPDNASKEEASSEIFWNQHDDFYQPVNKTMACIDQISFPKEHDVDSVEGDSAYANNNHEPQRKQLETSSAAQVHSVQETVAWDKSDLIPVRFQQWVIDNNSNGKDDSTTNAGYTSTDYFSGTHLSHTQPHNEKTNLDCTIEEISTDTEYFKPTSSFIGRVVSSEKSTPYYLNKDLSAAGGQLPKNGDMEELELKIDSIKENQTSALPTRVDQIRIETNSPNERPNSSANVLSCDRPGKFSRLESNFTLDKKSDTLSKKCTSYSGLKNQIIAHETRRNQDQHKRGKFNRKMDVKHEGRFKRSGRNPPNNQTFAVPKEESLPGETQPELLSWMAMCSKNLQQNNFTEGKEALERSQHCAQSDGNVDEDSPYNDIMTILRVLEEKEDESSLLRILKKDCQPRTQLDSTEQQINHISSSGHDINMSESSKNLIQKKEDSFSPRSSHSVKVLETDQRERSMDESLKKQAAKDGISKPTDALCANDVVAPLPTVQGELRDILTFLDAVDKSCSSVLQPNPTSYPRDSTVPLFSSENSKDLEELLSMGRTELAQEIVSLRLALEDRDATINLLRTALREQKDNQAKQNAAYTTELECRMRQVKGESEAIIKRHQKFIDQLISDKASLSERCESLLQDVRKCEEKHTKELSNIEAKHKVEIQRVKDITAATEKLKRERWVENKTQKIKELTVRGLEPELTRLTAQHEQEMSALRTLHAQELEQMEVRAARRASQQMETLREQLVQEKEDALTREREVLRQRMEKQQILYEEEGAEQRRRLVSEVRREQDRLATLEARLEAQFEERKRGIEREAEQEKERVRRDYADKLTEMHRKQQNEILQLREALKAEKENWMETYQQKQKQTLTQTTNEIREQLKRERDREIEAVIERLENEASMSQEEREKVSENRLKRVREQLTTELRDVESALNSLKEKHSELRAHLQEKEDKLASSEALNRSLQTQLVETRKISDQLSAERADIKQVLRSELHNEMKSLRQQLSEEHLRHQQQQKTLSEQVERERQSHQQELQQLYDRVKLAIAKKEEVVKVAREKQKAAEEQNSHLQALLDHRRKESLLS